MQAAAQSPETTQEKTFPAIDAVVARVKQNAARWLAVPLEQRVQYLERCMDALQTVAPAWAHATSTYRGLDPNGPTGGEAWLGEVMPTMRCLRLTADALRHGGQPPLPDKTTRPDGREVVQVYPTDLMDKLLFSGVKAHVWLEKGKSATQGALYRDKAAGKTREPALSLVLGAGNVGSICPTDAIHKLFAEDEVVVVKTNPVNAYLTPFWEATLRPLIDDGFIAFVDGGAAEGVYLTQHPMVDTIHITGSDKTYDAIVWGGDPAEQRRRKASGQKVNDRFVSAELGCVTPIFVVPGQWSDKEMAYQARAVVATVTNNASFNCVAGKLLVTAKGWPQRRQFLDAVRAAFSRVPPRKAYYPGSDQRYAGFTAAYPKAEAIGTQAPGAVPWTMVEDLDPEADEYAFKNEAWCGVLAETGLDASGASDFMAKATAFGNDKVWGTLSCDVIIDPRTRKQHFEAFDRMLDQLRYGAIAVNIFSGAVFALSSPPWGAYPGHTPEDIQSGVGTVHNTYMLDHPEKTVLEAPFIMFPPPVWFDGHLGGHEVGRRMVAQERRRSWLGLPGLVFWALRAG